MAEPKTVPPHPGGDETGSEAYHAAAGAVTAGRFDEAIPVLRRIIAEAPEHVSARVLLGISLAGSDQPGPAEGMLRSAAAIDPINIEARLRLGDLLVTLGRADEALTEFRAVLTVDPDHPAARQQVIALSGSGAP